MDPQQRHLLEVSYEALENAGIPMRKLAGTKTGVFVGGSNSDYRTHIYQDLENLPMFEATGNESSLLSNRLSYTYDLKGPSLTLDTACSSSLSALHTAFRSLQTGESSLAIVGGSNLNIRPEPFISLSTTRQVMAARTLYLQLTIMQGCCLLTGARMPLMNEPRVASGVARVRFA